MTSVIPVSGNRTRVSRAAVLEIHGMLTKFSASLMNGGHAHKIDWSFITAAMESIHQNLVIDGATDPAIVTDQYLHPRNVSNIAVSATHIILHAIHESHNAKLKGMPPTAGQLAFTLARHGLMSEGRYKILCAIGEHFKEFQQLHLPVSPEGMPQSEELRASLTALNLLLNMDDRALARLHPAMRALLSVKIKELPNALPETMQLFKNVLVDSLDGLLLERERLLNPPTIISR